MAYSPIIADKIFKGIHYRHIDNSKKHTLLFLHGFTGNSTIWDNLIKELKGRYNFLLIDIVGHGDSYTPSTIEGYSFISQCNKIRGILNRLQVKSLSIVCYSYSCYMGIILSKKIPKKIRHIVFISPYFKRGYEFLGKQITKCIKYIWKYLLPDKKFHLDYSNIKDYENPRFKDTRHILSCINTKDVLGTIYSLIVFEDISDLTRLKHKLLIIRGENDKAFNQYHLKNLPNVEFKCIKNKKHLFLRTRTREIAKHIELFLET